MPKQARKRKHEQKLDEKDIRKPKYKPQEDKSEEEQLSKILFGGPTSFLRCLEEAEKESPSTSNIDSGVGEDDSNESEEDRKPAWFDDDDDGIEVGQALTAQRRKLPNGGENTRTNKYSNLLKHKFQNVVGKPKWAKLGKKEETDSDEELLQTCGFIRKVDRADLPESVLEFKKVKDLNHETYIEGPYINAVEFHPTSTVGFVAGNSGVLSLFAVDGKRNNKLHTVAFERYSILSGQFLKQGNEILLGSRHSHIFSYDLMAAKHTRISLPQGLTQFKKFAVSPNHDLLAVAGKWGEVHLLHAASKERITILKQDSQCTSLTFNPQGNLLFGHGETGQVTIWDLNMQRVKHKFVDEGCLQGTTIAISPSSQFLACGSAQGIVNLYGYEDTLKQSLPKPRRTIMNLTTEINGLKFNSSSEILAFSSGDIKNSIKLFHLGSGSVFSNFPPFESKFGNVSCVSFSPSSGYFAIGNRKSTVALYRLKHFKNY